MSIVGLDQVGSNIAQANETQTSVMGKDDFLTLLVAQLQHQDPLNPADSTEFTAQLATFSSLEELQNINTALEGVTDSQAMLTKSQAVDYIGKNIKALGDHIYMDNGNVEPFAVNLDADATGVYINVYNEYGEFIRNIECGPMTAGQNSVVWDGLDNQGGQVPDGAYRYEAMATDADNNDLPVTTFTSGIVTGVFYKNGLAYLTTANQEIPFGDVVEVNEVQNSTQPII